MAVFHSVSAFCNAGFDILGRADALYPSLTAYTADPLVNIVIMLLIVVGGIGFLTWDDVCTHRLHLRRYRMQSKVILSATVILIALPALFFFLTDFAELPAGQRVLASLFQAVTPRTAGYNTADLTKMSDTSQAVTILLMLTGGAPGSTVGGMKVTTLAVLAANAVAAFRRREDPQLFKRRLEPSAVRNAAAILLLGGVRWTLSSGSLWKRIPQAPAVLAGGCMLVGGVAAAFALGGDPYRLLMAVAVSMLAAGSAWFFARSFVILRSRVASAYQEELGCLYVTFLLIAAGLGQVTVAGISAGRVLASAGVLLERCLERWL